MIKHIIQTYSVALNQLLYSYIIKASHVIPSVSKYNLLPHIIEILNLVNSRLCKMFESEWDEDRDQPQLSALSRALVQSQPKKAKRETLGKVNSETKQKKSKSEKKLKNVAQRLALSVDNGIDKYVNSPSATKKLLSDDDGDGESDESPMKENRKKSKKSKLVKRLKSSAAVVNETRKKVGRSLSDSSLKETGHLLKLGAKFSSQDAFLRFIGLPSKVKKKGKLEISSENVGDTESLVDEVIEDEEDNEEAPTAPPRKKRKEGGLDIDKLKDILAKEDQKEAASKNAKNGIHKTLAEEARDKLSASRFRYLNEQLYTQPSNAAVKLFSSDSTLFNAYHQVNFIEVFNTFINVCINNLNRVTSTKPSSGLWIPWM